MVRTRTRKSLEGLIASSPVVSARLSPDGTAVTYVSPNVESVTGFTSGVVTGSGFHWMDLVHADDRAAARDAIAEIADRRAEHTESAFRVVGADGVEHWLRAVFRRDQDGSDDLLGFFMDAYEPRVADDHARVAGDLLQSVLDDTSASVYVKDLQGRFLVVNRQIEEDFGIPRDQLLGRSAIDVWPRERAELFSASDRAALEAGEPIQVEEIANHSDGPHTYLSLKFPMRDETGATYAIGGIATDITGRKHVEDDLREQEQTLQGIVEASPDAILILTPEFTIKEASRAIEKLHGLPVDEHRGRSPLDVVHPDDHSVAEAALRRLLEPDGGAMEVRYRVRHVDGHWVPVEARGRVLLDAAGHPSGAVVVQRDISEAVAAQEALQGAKAEAERANHAKSEFLSRMSHELRTPLNSVIGFAQILEMNLGPHPEQESVRYIYEAGRHLLDLINEVLDISRIETGTMTVSLEPVSLEILARECLDLVTPQARERGIRIVNYVGPDRHVRGDRQRLRQVLLNLLSNAIKFNRDHGSVTLHSEARDEWVRIAVTDTGAGITPELAERLFVPFDRLEADAAGIEGTGLGLALSQQLVNTMGGTLGVDSAPGQGSTFWFELPVGPAEGSADARAASPAVPHEVPTTATLLYVEDNLANVRLIEHLLQHRPGIRLLSALQASLGLELAAQHHPDLILLDGHLPDLPGEVVLQRLRADPRTSSIPVVVLSADATESQIRHFRDAGAADYLTKPLDLRRLLALLDEYLGAGDPASSAAETFSAVLP
jgi:PAS domain S-box-containing protein